jgi:cell division protein FtsB
MTQLFILAAQSVTGAVMTIIGLLLVAGIIGYLSAWFYAKSIYTPVIKKLQSENEELKTRIEGLNRQVEVMKSEIIKLNGTIEGQGERIKSLEKEVDEKTKELNKLAKPVKEK